MAATTPGVFSTVPSVASLRFLLLRTQKNMRPNTASTTTTIGTATAACIPGDDMVTDSACKSFAELLAALDAVGAVEDAALSMAEDSAVDAAGVEEADAAGCDALALDAATDSVGAELIADEVTVSSVVGCDVVGDAEAAELTLPSLDASEACNEDCWGDNDPVAVAKATISALMSDAIDAKLAESMLFVGVNGPLKPEREAMLNYVCNRLMHKACRVPWRSTKGKIGALYGNTRCMNSCRKQFLEDYQGRCS